MNGVIQVMALCTIELSHSFNIKQDQSKYNFYSYKLNQLDTLAFHYQLMHLLIKNTFTVHI